MIWRRPFIIMVVCAAIPAAASDRIDALLAERSAQLNACMSRLPAREAIAWRDSRGRGTYPASCKTAKVLRDDARDMKKLQSDLFKLTQKVPLSSDQLAVAQRESTEIAVNMIETTRKLADEFQMVNSSILNNVLVNIGAKKGGQCYQWVRGLLAAMPQKPYQIYERWWGGSHLHKFLENNSVVWTVRGQKFDTGIVYDAWRGNGDPWWRPVTRDYYTWSVRFDEAQILSGEATVQGTAELKHQ